MESAGNTEGSREISGLLPNLIVLFFLAVGILNSRAPLDTARPEITGAKELERRRVLARLWEDPLGFSDEERLEWQEAPIGTDWGTSKPLDRRIARAQKAKDGAWREHFPEDHNPPRARILVMPVLLDGNPYAETIEERLRIRYAVVSALGRAQFVPVDPGYMSFIRVPRSTLRTSRGYAWRNLDRDRQQTAPAAAPTSKGEKTADEKGTQPTREQYLDIPFEEFEVRYLVADRVAMARDAPAVSSEYINENYWPADSREADDKTVTITNPYDRVIVLWLDENDLDDNGRVRRDGSSPPSALMARMIDRIVSTCVSPENFNGGSPACDLKIMGPTGSDALLEFTGSVEFRSGHTAEWIHTQILEALRGLRRSSGAVRDSRWDTLLTTIIRGTDRPAPPFNPSIGKAEIFSPRATAADAVIQISSTHQTAFHRHSVTDQLVSPVGDVPAWRVRRTIATDDRLVETLLRELELRHAAPSRGGGGSNENYMVLVGEWDTLYARGLGRTLAARLAAGRDPSDADRATWSAEVGTLHEISYLRGLDGRRPKSAGADAKNETPEDAELQRPTGQSQFDYLRRLAGELRAMQNDLQRSRKGRIASIGVVGSDVYDKLLVLRALRASFPDVVFFTTDVDALYFEPTESEWTRNLIVVSSFGLSAHEDLQGRIPPFRDSYQTATFLTVLRAVNVTNVGTRPFVVDSRIIEPRVFELGSLGAVDLTPPESGPMAPLQRKRDEPTRTRWWSGRGLGLFMAVSVVVAFLAVTFWEPSFSRTWPWVSFRDENAAARRQFGFGVLWIASFSGLIGGITWTSREGGVFAGGTGSFLRFCLILALFVTILAAFWVLYRVALLFEGGRRRNRTRNAWRVYAMFAAQAVLGISILTYAIVEVFGSSDEEPFAWFQGVSIWPTEILRGVGMLLSVGFVVSALRRLREFDIQIGKTMKTLGVLKTGGMAPTPKENSPSEKLSIVERWRRLFFRFDSTLKKNLPLATLWASYLSVAQIRRRAGRIVIYLLLYVAVFAALMLVLDPPLVPARGQWSRSLDSAVLLGTVCSYMVLLILVFDATVICRDFISHLAANYRRAPNADDESVFEIIRNHAGLVSRLIYLPFSALFLMIVSRAAIFDNWSWPIPLIIVLGFGMFLIVAVTLMLQTAARQAKNTILKNLDDDIEAADARIREAMVKTTWPADVHLPADPVEIARTDREELQRCRKDIEDSEGGVLRAWHQLPLFRATLLTVGGLGSIQALEKLTSVLP